MIIRKIEDLSQEQLADLKGLVLDGAYLGQCNAMLLTEYVYDVGNYDVRMTYWDWRKFVTNVLKPMVKVPTKRVMRKRYR